MKLVIVESPTKTHTLKRYLGDDYEVIASIGHIRDLAIKGKNGYGVDIENNFSPTYTINKDKTKVVSELVKTSNKADEIILATDPDREGEAIAWHLANVLNLDVNKTKRLEFHEITRESITEAIKNPRTIDLNLVSSQETRRIIDRIMGFDLSKISKKYIKSQSAGRVQSVTLKLICEHENKILNFKPQKYYSIDLKFEKDNLKIILDSYKNKKIDKIFDQNISNEIFSKIGDKLIVSNIELKEKITKSKEPFTTSTLQQEAFNRYNFSTKETSLVAQKLYEGVETEEGLVGLITYMRTDSTKLSKPYIERAKNYIIEKYGEEYFSGAKSKKHIQNAQEAHEAIRPTGNHRTPESLKKYLTKREYQLYKLIYERAQASLMSDKKEEVSTYTLTSNTSNEVLFKTDSYKTIFKGYSILYSDDEEKNHIKNLKMNDEIKIINKKITENETKPSPRYSEAKVVKLMEEVGIGRPSTYSSTIQILKTRGYITIKKGIVQPTEQGMLTSKFLELNFPYFVNENYTAKMEKELDQIQVGSNSRLNILNSFYKKLNEDLDQFNKNPKFLPEKKEAEKTGEKCPKCGNDLVKRKSKYGEFIACSNFPSCRYIKKEENKEKEKKEIKYANKKCPNCGGELVYRTSKKGEFLGCLNFPKCRYIESIIKDDTKKD